MNILVIGAGEVGSAHAQILGDDPTNKIWIEDTNPKLREMDDLPDHFDAMLVAIRHTEEFQSIVLNYFHKYSPHHLNILSTVPPGTSENVWFRACHSTTRGLHPDLTTGLRSIHKHIGGPDAEWFAELYELAGMKCVTHAKARTPETCGRIGLVSHWQPSIRLPSTGSRRTEHLLSPPSIRIVDDGGRVRGDGCRGQAASQRQEDLQR